MHLAVNRNDPHDTKPILYQLKARLSGQLKEAVDSLNIGQMHPDTMRSKQVAESSAHASMRKTLEDKDYIGLRNPIRIVVGLRHYDSAVLHHVAWFNRHQWYDSPLILLRVGADNLGVSISPLSQIRPIPNNYGVPKNWDKIFPGKLRHASHIAGVHQAVPSPAIDGLDEVKSVSLKVTVRIDTKLPAIVRTKKWKDNFESELASLMGMYDTDVIKWSHLGSTVVITFADIRRAIYLVEKKECIIRELRCGFSFT